MKGTISLVVAGSTSGDRVGGGEPRRAGGGAGGVWLAPISTGAASSAVQNIDRLKRWVIAGILCIF